MTKNTRVTKPKKTSIRKVRKKKLVQKCKKKEISYICINMATLEPEFRQIVQQWAIGKKFIKVKRLFTLLQKFHCPVHPSYSPNESKIESLLRKNNCGIRKLHYGLYICEHIDCLTKQESTLFEDANELNEILTNIAEI